MVEIGIAERWVVGAMFIDPWKAIATARTIIGPEDFQDAQLRTLFEVGASLADRGMPTDVNLVWREASKQAGKSVPSIRDLAYLLEKTTPVAAHVEFYARCMVEDACKRAAMAVSGDLEGDQSPQAVESALARLAALNERLASLERKHKAMLEGRLTDTAIEYLEAAKRDKEGGRGNVPTALAGLDSYIGGPLPLGSYVILGACSGNGKTLFMLQMLRNAARAGHRCVFYSQEMSAVAVGERLVSMATEDENGNAADIMADVEAAFSNGEEIIFRQCDSRVSSICADMKRMIDDRGANVFAIDYLGLLRGTGKDRYEQMTQVNSQIKTFATSNNVTIVMGCQLNRSVMNQKPPIPQKHHLRDSGEIEAAADAIFLLRFPSKDTPASEINKTLAEQRIDHLKPEELFEIHVPKLRNRQTKGECYVCSLRKSPLRLAPLMETTERPGYSEALAGF